MITNRQIRFVLVGGLNTAVDIVIYTVLSSLGLMFVIANLISTSCGMALSYTLNRSFTFKSRSKNKKREVVLFLAVTIFGLWVIQPAIIFIFDHVFISILKLLPVLLQTLLPKCAAIFFGLVWNYVWYSKVVFKNVENDETNSLT